MALVDISTLSKIKVANQQMVTLDSKFKQNMKSGLYQPTQHTAVINRDDVLKISDYLSTKLIVQSFCVIGSGMTFLYICVTVARVSPTVDEVQPHSSFCMTRMARRVW